MSKKEDYIGFFKVDERQTLIWKNLEDVKKFMKSLPTGKYMIKISEYVDTRSIDQNRYYWKLLEIIGNEIGYEPEEMHEVYKFKFLRKTFEDKNGNLVKGVMSTTKLNIEEFKEYIEKIKRHVRLSLQITIPETFD